MKSLATTPPRLQRILLRMQKYDYTLEYKPGKEFLLPDMLSRAPLPDTRYSNMEDEIVLHVHLVQSSLPVSKCKVDEIRKETAKDQSLRNVSEINLDTRVCMYWDVRDELSELNGIILRGERIVIPTFIRKDMLERIHQGHMGIEKFRRRARDVLYWPRMSSEIQDKISRRSVCL